MAIHVLLAAFAADAEKLRDAASHAAARRPLAPTSAAPPIFRRKGAEQQLHAAFLLAEPGEYQRWLGFTVTALCETKEHVSGGLWCIYGAYDPLHCLYRDMYRVCAWPQGESMVWFFVCNRIPIGL